MLEKKQNELRYARADIGDVRRLHALRQRNAMMGVVKGWSLLDSWRGRSQYFRQLQKRPKLIVDEWDKALFFQQNCAQVFFHRLEVVDTTMPTQLARAAMRQKRCANHLAEKLEQSEASYLIGLAAECALKYYLKSVGFPLERRRRQKHASSPSPDVMYLHFPELIGELLAQGQGIIAGRVLAKVSDPALLNGWTVRMRYRDQPSTPTIRARYERWRVQTDAIFVEVVTCH